jgi:oxygen-independent coproporphyrinogen-3 oxidase
MGVQSFVEDETRELGRSQRPADAHQALETIREHGFYTRNVDLIYGMRGQTRASWKFTLESALQHEPEEVYLYPLYVRPLTGMQRLDRMPGDGRLERYREGRDFLLSRGYRQFSMRLFRKASHQSAEGPVYCCQEDGMVGLGVGARSYATALHYCTEYAVGRTGVRAITQAFIERTSQAHAVADFGCELDEGEQMRRYVIKSLLRADGLDLMAYQARFSSAALDDFPELQELVERRLAEQCGLNLLLNERGMELSDVIGPWMVSDLVHERMGAYQLR